jgi:hypothetical protein
MLMSAVVKTYNEGADVSSVGRGQEEKRKKVMAFLNYFFMSNSALFTNLLRRFLTCFGLRQ